MYKPIEDDDSDTLSEEPSTSGLQQFVGVSPSDSGLKKTTIPQWDVEGDSDLEIIDVKEIPSKFLKTDYASSGDETEEESGFINNPFKW